jgi:hypothetical protein
LRKLVASTPQAEIKGTILQAFFQCITHSELVPILKKYNLENLDPERWYPQQLMLDIYRDIEEHQFNVTENFVSVGMKIMDLAAFPPSVSSVEDALPGLRIAYNMDHRNHTETGWIVDFVEPGKVMMVADNPYPDDQHYGLLWSLVRRFSPKGTGFSVTPQPHDNPDENTVFEIKWDVN